MQCKQILLTASNLGAVLFADASKRQITDGGQRTEQQLFAQINPFLLDAAQWYCVRVVDGAGRMVFIGWRISIDGVGLDDGTAFGICCRRLLVFGFEAVDLFNDCLGPLKVVALFTQNRLKIYTCKMFTLSYSV